MGERARAPRIQADAARGRAGEIQRHTAACMAHTHDLVCASKALLDRIGHPHATAPARGRSI
jgi:hypothetical protein